jgi:hypothetical protein
MAHQGLRKAHSLRDQICVFRSEEASSRIASSYRGGARGARDRIEVMFARHEQYIVFLYKTHAVQRTSRGDIVSDATLHIKVDAREVKHFLAI